MALLGYTLFKEEVRSGKKRQTIRKLRKRPIKKREALYHYWHLRQRDCEKLLTSICTETFFISISYLRGDIDMTWRIDRHPLPRQFEGYQMQEEEAMDLARRDCFNGVKELIFALEKMHGDLHNQIFQVIRW